MMCVSSVTYSIRVNGRLVGPIIPKRGLRQGDPLSPYLSIICAEGLSFFIKDAESKGLIHGSRVCRKAPTVSHLFFADDSLLFFRASLVECNQLKKLLELYKRASGQVVNFGKSGIFFSSNIPLILKDAICETLGVWQPLNTGKYLGLPSLIGRRKKEVFGHVKDKLWKYIHQWRAKMLSRGGKEVLIKAVAQSIPSYFMSTFLLPDSLLDELEK
ncbi:hypothetical protein DH2020_037861 [Rehmannia glutinosa]|uniref:Reverse transcriptase domain-containing protein n=1 Tax=Rehmannia glutinosa TaxID=99300 RepID=A0ABR0V1Y5_REHGL